MRINVQCEHCAKMTHATEGELEEYFELASDEELICLRENINFYIGPPISENIDVISLEDELKLKELKKLFNNCTLQQIENIVKQFVKTN